jgi:plasmid stabilization system protein ParE
MGRLCEHIRPGLRRMENAQHVIFYRIDSGDILNLAHLASAYVDGKISH